MVISPERTSGSNGGGSGAIAVTAHRTASRAEHDRERERLRADAEVDKVCRRACVHGRRCCGSGSASAVAPHHQCGGSRDLGEPARRSHRASEVAPLLGRAPRRSAVLYFGRVPASVPPARVRPDRGECWIGWGEHMRSSGLAAQAHKSWDRAGHGTAAPFHHPCLQG